MKLSEATQGFILYLRGESYSPVTVKSYGEFMGVICREIGDAEVEKLKTDDLRSFLLKRGEGGAKPSTVQAYWKVLRSFFGWAEKEIGLRCNPAAPIKAPRFVPAEVQPYSESEINKIFEAAKSRRNRALFAVLLDTGVRVGELVRMTVGDYNPDTGTIEIKPYTTGRKSRPRLVYLGKRSKTILWSYLSNRKDITEKSPLIAALDGETWTRNGVLILCKRVQERAGVRGMHPHRFRHTFAIEFLRNGGDVFTLQRILGHSSLEMVKMYLQLADSDAAKAHQRASPMDRMKTK